MSCLLSIDLQWQCGPWSGYCSAGNRELLALSMQQIQAAASTQGVASMSETQRAKMQQSIRAWSKLLNEHPGWRDWQRNRVGHTLHFDDAFSAPVERLPKEFEFPREIGFQHSIVMQYLALLEAIEALRECEYYFRRYPFYGLPVSRYNHFKNSCEMYFARFYEFRERLKAYLNTLKSIPHGTNLDVGRFVKLYDKDFDAEIRERNQINHHRRFEDLALDRLLLLSLVATRPEDKGWRRELRSAYRTAANEWVQRVRRRAVRLDQYMEVVAEITLARCLFLSINSKGTAGSS